MSETCNLVDCDRPMRYPTSGLCQYHYKRRRAARLGKPNRNTASGADLAVRVADLRLALEMARARVTQALMVLEDPAVGHKHNVTAGDLLASALDHLDAGRQSAPQPKE